MVWVTTKKYKCDVKNDAGDDVKNDAGDDAKNDAGDDAGDDTGAEKQVFPAAVPTDADTVLLFDMVLIITPLFYNPKRKTVDFF